MADVFDAAAYILKVCDDCGELPITTWKLQKLVYYSQAWSLVWDDEPLFLEEIQAWANGPVCPALYNEHRGKFKIREIALGNPNELTREQKDTIEVVFEHYGEKSSQYLSELTHQERPWKDAREGLAPGDRGQRVITLESMAEYYGSL